MKIGYQRVIDAISALDPATFSAIASMKLCLTNGTNFVTDDATIMDKCVYARHAGDADTWRLIPVEEIGCVEITINRADLAALAKENATEIEPTLAGVLKWATSR